MVGPSNERDRKVISVHTSASDLGTRFSKVTLFRITQFTIYSQKKHELLNTKIITLNYITLCIKRHERNGEKS